MPDTREDDVPIRVAVMFILDSNHLLPYSALRCSPLTAVTATHYKFRLDSGTVIESHSSNNDISAMDFAKVEFQCYRGDGSLPSHTLRCPHIGDRRRIPLNSRDLTYLLRCCPCSAAAIPPQIWGTWHPTAFGCWASGRCTRETRFRCRLAGGKAS